MNNKASNPSEGFFIVPNDLIDFYGPALGAYGLAIYMILKRHESFKTKTCFPSYQTIRRLTGFSRDTISRYIKLIGSLVLISITKRRNSSNGNTANLYRILIPQVPVPKHIAGLFPNKFGPKTLKSPNRNNTALTPIYPLSNLLPRSNSDAPQSISNIDLVDESDANKTFQQNEVNNTHLTYTEDCKSETELLKPYYQELKKIYPEIDDVKFQFLWELALKRKSQDPTKARKLLGYIIKSARKKQKGSIRTILPWLVSAIKKNNWYDPEQHSKSKPNKTSNYPAIRKPIVKKDEEENNGEELAI